MRNCGEFANFLTPILEIVQRAAADNKIVLPSEKVPFVIAQVNFRQQFASESAEIGYIIAMVLEPDFWKEGRAVEVVMTNSTTPVQYGEKFFPSRRQRQDISVSHHYVMICPILARFVPREMSNTQRSRSLQVLHEGRPMLFLSFCNDLIVPTLDDMPALRHVFHLGENVLNNA